MSRLPRKANRWKHGAARFALPALEDLMGMLDGVVPAMVVLDPEIGQEVVLFIRDQTPFMEELRRIRPFRLMMKTGVGRNAFGPLMFLLFWVPNPGAPHQPAAAWDLYLNPHSKEQAATWRELAAQSHWHVFLVGAGGEQEGFFEFENTHALDEGLDFAEQACAGIQMVDFDRAKHKFMDEHSVSDLLKM